MSGASTRRAWLQKHPTPLASDGEFHWYEEDGALEADVRARVVEEVQGVAPPAVWWEVTPRRVLWAAVFSAVAPGDARPYRGVALTVIEREGDGEGGAAALLEQLRPARAAPWTNPRDDHDAQDDDGDERDGTATLEPHRPARAGSRTQARSPATSEVEARCTDHDARTAKLELDGLANARAPGAERADGAPRGCAPAEVARVILEGGAATVEDPHAEALPRQLATLWRWLPAALAEEPRRGQWRARGTAAPGAAGDEVAAMLAAAWQPADEDERLAAPAAWTLLTELARARGQRLAEVMIHCERARERAAGRRPLDELLGPRARVAWRTSAGAAPAWRRLVHCWGRGWLDADAADPPLAARLAEELALRALAALRRRAPVAPVLAEVRWHALLPRDRRDALQRELARIAPSLAGWGAAARWRGVAHAS